MEQLSNLAWLVVTLVAFAAMLWALRRGAVRVSTGTAVVLLLLICLLLLPVISVSDDLIEARQATLPLAAQTWHMAAESASVGLEIVSIISVFMLLLALGAERSLCMFALEWVDRRQIGAWLTRSQRLRPPPVFAH